MRRTRSKRTKTVKKINPKALEDQNNFFQIPLDVVIEIVGRLPSKSVARFLIVSKSWETFIRSRDFITSFPLGSSSQPRLLITFSESSNRKRRQNLDFFSSSSSETSFISRFTCPFSAPEHNEYLPQFVNGLISLGFGEEQIIYNPTTGKSITLPKVVMRRKIVKTYLGYDPINDQYKVLCLTERIHDNHRNFQFSHDKVFTVGERESWRVMDCSIPHRPWSNGLCIDGVLYYLAFTGKGMLQRSLMRFDVRSEKLDLLTDLFADLIAPHAFRNVYTLIKYEGKVAIATKALVYTFLVWVMEEHGWLKKSFSVEPYCKSLQIKYFQITGTTQTGEFILAPYSASNAFYVVFYDPKSDSCRNIKIEVNSDDEFGTRFVRLILLSDYVENVRFCLGVS
ncbi:unnamed protein product [Microthlaspi erraticum]|uniref:F-box domain-containing protein n=1 Tax=Microthlaspi erraticum TaxID=1685480 RepID=A0A6D2ICV0_9BRAS|nr:unnamed protein product [Microthlaspi erraticum]